SSLVDKLGGIEVCLSENVQSTQSGVNIPAGTSTITGETALALARARHGEGLSGSDLDRVERNQIIFGGLATRILDSGMLEKPKDLVDLVSWLTSSTETDAALS